MRIFIFTLATSVYNTFIQKQKETFKYLFPNLEKYYIIISDVKPDFIDNDHYLFYKIDDLPYPLVTLNKYVYIKAAIPEFATDDDLFLFFDADTYFKETPDDVFEYVLDKLQNYDLIFSYSPWYLLPKLYHIDDNDPFFCWWKNLDKNYVSFADYMNDTVRGSSYYDIDEKTVYVQTSVLGGKLGKLKELNDDVRKLVSRDLNDKYCNSYYDRYRDLTRHLPIASEENYTNKIINDHIHNKTCKYNFYIDTFHSFDYLYNMYNFKDFPHIICGQKYNNGGEKASKRNCVE